MHSAVRVEGLTKQFGDHTALDGLHLAVPVGAVFGFLGPNGAGKTTTLRILLGLSRPTSGSVTVLGVPLHEGSTELRRRIGYLPGNLALPERLTGHSFLNDLAALRGRDLRRQHELLAERLDADLNRPMGQLSSGNRRKIGLIGAFAPEPELIVLDEPTGGMDPLVQRTFRELAREAAADGRTVLLSSHVLDEVQHAADQVAVLRSGQLVAQGRIDELLHHVERTVHLTFAAPLPITAVEHLPHEVMSSEISENQLIVTLAGPAGPLLKAVAQWDLVDVRTTEPDLEDVFLSYYGSGDHSASDSVDGSMP